jgi:uridine nucleosidase
VSKCRPPRHGRADHAAQDAFAILLAAHCRRLRLLGISTVHGNASLENTTRNTLSILEAVGRRGVPVHPGAAKPLCRDAVHAVAIHGAPPNPAPSWVRLTVRA